MGFHRLMTCCHLARWLNDCQSGFFYTLPERTLFWKMDDEIAVRNGDWKLIQLGEKAPELYQISKDIGERDDLSDRYPEIVADLQMAYDEWQDEIKTYMSRWEDSE